MKVFMKSVARAASVLAIAGVAAAAPLVANSDLLSAPSAQAGSCGGRAFAAPLNKWGPVANSSCNVAGSPGHQVCYTINIIGNGIPVVQARGYDINGNEQWYSIPNSTGCVPWGNVLAVPGIRATTPNVTGVQVTFSH